MAIIIPSKHIYEVNNPKVLNNALKSFDSTQYKNRLVIIDNPNPISQDLILTDDETTIAQRYNRVFPTVTYGQGYLFTAGIKTETLWANSNVTLSRNHLKENISDDFYITEISPTLVTEFELTKSTVKAISYFGEIPSGQYRFEFTLDDAQNVRNSTSRNYSYDSISTSYDSKNEFKGESSINITPELISFAFNVYTTQDVEEGEDKTASRIVLENTPSTSTHTYPYSVSVEETKDAYEISIALAKNFKVWVATDYAPSDWQDRKQSRPVRAELYEFKLKNAQIVYNEKIKKIETTSNTYTYSNENSVGEEVLSIADNQFWRSEIEYNNTANAPRLLLEQTLALYEKGKETAAIRCSINDYYDNDGNKIISAETSDKMIFEHYDEVVPMYNNGKGMDEPISYNSEGLAKTFEVVGVRLFYDGAVWQELTLREKGSIAVNLLLPTPRITIRGSIATISEQSGLATEFGVYVNGRQMAIVNKGDALDLASLGLARGKYTITADSRTSSVGYRTSPKSRGIVYEVKPHLEYYTEVNESGGLTYHITAEDYKIIGGTYVIGD